MSDVNTQLAETTADNPIVTNPPRDSYAYQVIITATVYASTAESVHEHLPAFLPRELLDPQIDVGALQPETGVFNIGGITHELRLVMHEFGISAYRDSEDILSKDDVTLEDLIPYFTAISGKTAQDDLLCEEFARLIDQVGEGAQLSQLVELDMRTSDYAQFLFEGLDIVE